MQENTDAREIQAEYEDLLVKFETQRIASELKINFLETKLSEVGSSAACTQQKNSIISSRESEALLVIKQLEEQIKILESEKSSSQQNLDSLADLAMEQNISARKEIEELQEELLNAKEAARIACGRHASTEPSVTDEGDIDSMTELSIDIEGIAMEIQKLKNFVDSIFCLVDDAFRNISSISGNFLDLKNFSRGTSEATEEFATQQFQSTTLRRKKRRGPVRRKLNTENVTRMDPPEPQMAEPQMDPPEHPSCPRVRSSAPELSSCRALVLSPQPLKSGKTKKKTTVRASRTSPRFVRRSTQ